MSVAITTVHQVESQTMESVYSSNGKEEVEICWCDVCIQCENCLCDLHAVVRICSTIMAWSRDDMLTWKHPHTFLS